MSDPCQTHLVQKASSCEAYHRYLLRLTGKTVLLIASLLPLCSSFRFCNPADKTDTDTGQVDPCSQRQMDFETNKQTKTAEVPHKSFLAFVLSAYRRQLLFFHTAFFFRCYLLFGHSLLLVQHDLRESAQSASKRELQLLCNTHRLALQEGFPLSFLRAFPLPYQGYRILQPADKNRTMENGCCRFHELTSVLTNPTHLFSCHRFWVDSCALPKDPSLESIPHTNPPVFHKKQHFGEFFPN